MLQGTWLIINSVPQTQNAEHHGYINSVPNRLRQCITLFPSWFQLSLQSPFPYFPWGHRSHNYFFDKAAFLSLGLCMQRKHGVLLLSARFYRDPVTTVSPLVFSPAPPGKGFVRTAPMSSLQRTPSESALIVPHLSLSRWWQRLLPRSTDFTLFISAFFQVLGNDQPLINICGIVWGFPPGFQATLSLLVIRFSKIASQNSFRTNLKYLLLLKYDLAFPISHPITYRPVLIRLCSAMIVSTSEEVWLQTHFSVSTHDSCDPKDSFVCICVYVYVHSCVYTSVEGCTCMCV